MDKPPFTFEISLSVLNHLGRNLYRSFTTVLGEAISNSWDADADNVWIYVDKTNNSFVIKDDGDGMSADDFQNKFLRIGYSKRKIGETHSRKNRPYIGRKGIGKLALLSCAEKISIISKTKQGEQIGGLIDNEGLDKAITNDMIPQDYVLGNPRPSDFTRYIRDLKKGTVIRFDGMKEGIRNSLASIRKVLALYFRFSLIDKSFKIFVDDKQITLDDLSDLAEHTEFLWNINHLTDPYITKTIKYNKKNLVTQINLQEPPKVIEAKGGFKGFIASVRKPAYLKITDMDEKVGVDLFVNGRLRERDILRHIPTAKVPENYFYGQIHFNGLDDERDRFATGREGIIADDERYRAFLDDLRFVVGRVIPSWDDWRRKHHQEGDPDNPIIPPKERKAEELFNVVAEDYSIPADTGRPKAKEEVDQWVDDLTGDARYNFSSYADCFVSENLVRKHIKANRVQLSKEAKEEVQTWKTKEKANKNKGNVSVRIRRTPADTSYLSMDHLANLVDKKDPVKEASLSRDAAEYKPIRDAVMHTALLTEEAKDRLTSVYKNIKERVRTLLSAR